MTKHDKLISKCISYVLRHNPSAAGIKLDDEGWVDIDTLCRALNERKMASGVTRSAIENIIAESDKKRFEIRGNSIRATYGHSFNSKIEFEPTTPPNVLYHGTSNVAYQRISGGEGILPMNRQYVHLSSDFETAVRVGRRHDDHPIILTVDTARMSNDGFKFFHSGNDGTWMCEKVPNGYICSISNTDTCEKYA